MVPVDQLPLPELVGGVGRSLPDPVSRELLVSLSALLAYLRLPGVVRREVEKAFRRNSPYPMDVTWKGSPNFSRGRLLAKADRIVVHWMGGTLSGTDAHFSKPESKVSAHFGVEGTRVHQYVKLEDAAWHAGNWAWNLRSVGIEFSAQPGRALTDEGYATGSALIADVCRRLGIEPTLFTVLPHKAFRPTQCPGTVDVPRLVTGAREILYPHERILASMKVPVFVDTLENEPKGPNGYPQATVRARANVRDENWDVVEVLEPGTVQDVEGVVLRKPPAGSANGLYFRKPNGRYFWTAVTDYNPN